MAGSVNKVILVGNLGADPDVRSFQNGGKVANLSIATSDSWKDKTSGERKEKTEWHRVSILSDPLVRICEQYLKKGAKVYLEGQLETRKWTDQSGQERYTTEVVLRPFTGILTMLDGKSGDSSSYGNNSASNGQAFNDQSDSFSSFPPAGAYGQPSAGPKSGHSDLDDEVPF